MKYEKYETLLIEERADAAGVALVTLNRPAVLNAMNTRMFEELFDSARALAHDDTVRCVIYTGAGRSFCPGADLKERRGMDDAAWRKQHHIIEEAFLAIKEIPQPTIAAVEGHAYAGGFEVALMCDFIIASSTARFALAEVKRGIMPGGGGIQHLVRSAGMRRAKQYLFTGDPFDAAKAEQFGVVNEVTAEGGALGRSIEIARAILESAPMSVRFAKLAASRGGEVDFHTGYALDIAAYNVLVQTEDRVEGINAFNEKRKPVWKNR